MILPDTKITNLTPDNLGALRAGASWAFLNNKLFHSVFTITFLSIFSILSLQLSIKIYHYVKRNEILFGVTVLHMRKFLFNISLENMRGLCLISIFFVSVPDFGYSEPKKKELNCTFIPWLSIPKSVRYHISRWHTLFGTSRIVSPNWYFESMFEHRSCPILYVKFEHFGIDIP